MSILRSLYLRLTGRTSVEGIMARFTAVADDLRFFADAKQAEAEDLDNMAEELRLTAAVHEAEAANAVEESLLARQKAATIEKLFS